MGQRLELFHLKRDMGETRNLASEQAGRARRMQAMLHAWIRGQRAAVPGANPAFDGARQFEESRRVGG